LRAYALVNKELKAKDSKKYFSPQRLIKSGKASKHPNNLASQDLIFARDESKKSAEMEVSPAKSRNQMTGHYMESQ